MRGTFAVAVAAFLVAFCPDTIWTHQHDRQMTDLPVCPPDENGEVILFPKPENCSEFYQCSGGVLFTQHCPENLYYCAEKEVCSWTFEPNCTFDCIIAKTNSVPVEEKHVPAAAPECPPQVDKNLTLIANPDNCSAYYECDNGVPVPMGCPEGLYFCSEKDICTWVWEPGCIFDCDIVNTNPVLEEKFVLANETVCPPQNDGNLTFIANPNNCSAYYECDNGVPVPMGCPDDLYFCSEKDICTWKSEPGCKFDCIAVKKNPVLKEKYVPAAAPVCPPQVGDDLTLIANPDNCSAYYECDNGVPKPMGCPDDLYFCSEKETCAWESEPGCKFDCIAVKKNPVLKEKYVPAAAPVCPPQVGDDLTLIANSDNCSAYYECDNGVPKPMGCPEGLYFCSEKATCAWVWEPGCKFDCIAVKKNPVLKEKYVPAAAPVCPPQVGDDLTLIANSDNCSAYYECDNGVPKPMGCPEGLYFCSEKATCAWVWEPGCIFDCDIVKKETPVAVYDTGDTVNVMNHGKEILSIKGRRVSFEKYFD